MVVDGGYSTSWMSHFGFLRFQQSNHPEIFSKGNLKNEILHGEMGNYFFIFRVGGHFFHFSWVFLRQMIVLHLHLVSK